jgi:microcompartment protein CcmL/EutN
MTTPNTIGAVELSSIAMGYRVQDEMLKTAAVEVLVARTICSGKYFIIIAGTVSDVTAAVQAGLATGGEAVIDHLVIPNVHPAVFPALGQSVVLTAVQAEALGVIETFSGVSVVAAADAAAKAAEVTLFRISVAMALGGKGYLLLTGSVGAVQSAVRAGADQARQRGLLVNQVVIPRPSKQLFSDYV